MAVAVYSESVNRRYQAPVCSLSFCFAVLVLVGMILVPFYVAFASGNFWLKTNYLLEQPKIQFTFEVLLLLYGMNGNGEMQTWAWATRPEVRDTYEAYLRAPIIRAWPSDDNLDNIADLWSITMQMPLDADEKVYQVQAVAFFDYALTGRAGLHMDTIAYIEHSSPLPGLDLMVEAEARLHQRRPLSVRRENAHPELRFSDSITSAGPESMERNNIRNIIASYAKRNYTMELANQYKVWNPVSAMDTYSKVSNSFALNFTMRVPTDEVIYTPDIPEVLKVAWIQYFSLFVFFFIFFQALKMFVYTNQVLETVITTEGTTQYSTRKEHKF